MTYDEIIEQLEITKSKIKEIARSEYGGESWNDDLDARGKYERLQNPEYNKRYNRGQNEDYEYQGIRSISGKDILKDRELMDGAEFQELEPVANK